MKVLACWWNRVRAARLCPVATRVRYPVGPGHYDTVTECVHGRITVGTEVWTEYQA